MRNTKGSRPALGPVRILPGRHRPVEDRLDGISPVSWKFDRCAARVAKYRKHWFTAMNITLCIDDETIAEARKVAASQGKSLDQLIREDLERLIGVEDRARDWDELKALSGQGDARGWRFDRDELHERT